MLDRCPRPTTPSAIAAGQAGDQNVEDADDTADDSVEDGADGVHDAHETGADGAEDIRDLQSVSDGS